MNGQLEFDEFMNITEEKTLEQKKYRVPMADPCYYCLCNSCLNNAESRTITPDELPYDWKPCFFKGSEGNLCKGKLCVELYEVYGR
jgi:hypothetical protein